MNPASDGGPAFDAPTDAAAACYRYADAMLAERAKEKP